MKGASPFYFVKKRFMSFTSKKEKNKRLIKLSLNILMEGAPLLNQKQIVEELDKMGVKVSKPTINKAYNHLNELGSPSQKLLGSVLPALVKKLTQMVFNDEQNRFVLEKTPVTEVLQFVNQPNNREINMYEKGRMSLQDKINFIIDTQKEVIEIGLSLRTLTSYFTSRNRFEYRVHIEQMLKKGINFKLFLLNPNTPLAQLYFADRQEENRIQIIKNVITDLKVIQKELNLLGYKGTFELFQYNHFPYHHSMIIDNGYNNAKMLISHYIHGVRRANSPVLEFSQQRNPILFETYRKSIELTIAQSTLIE